MDDLSQILGVKYSPEQEATLTELARRANDRLRVQNLLDRDYFVEWDIYGAGGRFLIPANTKDIGYGKGQAVHPRYIAFKFFKEISNIILSAELQLRVKEENDKRAERGQKLMDKTFETGEELSFIYTNNLKVNDSNKLMELLPQIILGIEEEWGMNAIAYQKPEETIKWEQVNAIINRKVGTPAIDTAPPIMNQPKPQQTQEDDILKDIAA